MKNTEHLLAIKLVDDCANPCDFCPLHKQIGIDLQYNPILFCPVLKMVFTQTLDAEELKRKVSEAHSKIITTKSIRKKKTITFDVKRINLLEPKISE